MEKYNDLPEKIQQHLKTLISSSDLPDTDETLEKLFTVWIGKRKIFEEQIKLLKMKEVNTFDKDDAKGALILTYSGSILSIGPVKEDKRSIEYASIKLRSDVPDIVKSDEVTLPKMINVDEIAELEGSSLKQTSSIYTIAVCEDDVNPEEQENRIREATIFLTNGFVKINKILTVQEGESPEHFTSRSIISYIATKNELSASKVKQLIDDYLFVIETGMLLGEKVSLGKLGRAYLKKRAAQKARVGVNPATGEKITISAKPEMLVPRVSFSSYLKEKAKTISLGFEYSEDHEDHEDEESSYE